MKTSRPLRLAMRFIALPCRLLGLDCKGKVETGKVSSEIRLLPEKTVSFTVQVICATSGLISGNDLKLGWSMALSIQSQCECSF